MEVQIRGEQKKYPVQEYEVLLNKAFQILKTLEGLSGNLEISVLFVDEAAMQNLNRKYREIDEPTDVLSFPQDEQDDFFPSVDLPRSLGDIVISPKQAFMQAEKLQHSLKREVAYLAVHGMLHLLGYDHDTSQKQARMRRREEAVLKELDLGRG